MRLTCHPWFQTPQVAACGFAVLATLLLGPAITPATGQAQSAARSEHRVVVSTGMSDLESDVDGSLERHVNALAAAGFEVSAFMGGSGALIDQMLGRKPYTAGLVDHSGQIFVVMSRTPGARHVARSYELIHTRTPLGLDDVLAPLAAKGYVLAAYAHEGPLFHAAFEARPDGPSRRYRVFRNRGRTSWMDQALADADVMSRLTRVVPLALDAGLVELGEVQTPAGAMEWASIGAFKSASLEATLNAKAATGLRVQFARLRNNEFDVLLVRPAGPAGAAASYDVDDGPWGSPCTRGTIVGADPYTDGDVYCVAENPSGGPSNRGVDLIMRAPVATGLRPIEIPTCSERARLTSPRVAHGRIALAWQLERLLDAKVEAGYRLTRLFAVQRADGDARVVAFTTNQAAPPAVGAPATAAVPGRLVPELDLPLDTLLAQRQTELSAQVARDVAALDVDVWVDLLPASKTAVLSGCATTGTEKNLADTAVRMRLARPPYTDYRLRSDVIVDLWRRVQ